MFAALRRCPGRKTPKETRRDIALVTTIWGLLSTSDQPTGMRLARWAVHFGLSGIADRIPGASLAWAVTRA